MSLMKGNVCDLDSSVAILKEWFSVTECGAPFCVLGVMKRGVPDLTQSVESDVQCDFC